MTGLNLPRTCGVMLLPDCTLFPHGGLPLYIFEERYRKMLDDALEGECVFAVGRTKEDDNGPPVIGTAGLIRASKQGEDGTSQLLLHGVIRVRFTEWLEDTPYPCARIEPVTCEELEGAQGVAAVKTLRGAVEDLLSDASDEVRAGVMTLLDQADDASLMSDLVAQQFVQDADQRQELLDTEKVGERVKLLCAFLSSKP